MSTGLSKVEVICDMSKFAALKRLLSHLKVGGMTFTQVLGCGVEKGTKEYNLPIQCTVSALIAGAFAIFFGGAFLDGIAAALIGIVLKLIVYATEKTQVNMIFANVVCSFAVCSIAFAFVMLGFGYSTDKIIIGNIMLLIPGVALTNSIRDMISGDIMAGMLRFCEACLVSLAIAAGYIIAALIFGGIGK